MDSIVLLSHDPVVLTVFVIAGLASGIMIARKFLRSKTTHQPTSSSGSPPSTSRCMKFEIESYVGARPLLFGMTEEQAESAVGRPLKTWVNNLGEKDSQYESFSIRYSPQSGTLVEIGFSSDANVVIRG